MLENECTASQTLDQSQEGATKRDVMMMAGQMMAVASDQEASRAKFVLPLSVVSHEPLIELHRLKIPRAGAGWSLIGSN